MEWVVYNDCTATASGFGPDLNIRLGQTIILFEHPLHRQTAQCAVYFLQKKLIFALQKSSSKNIFNEVENILSDINF